MARPVGGWLVIVLGLSGVVGGLGMGYINWVVDQSERDQALWSDIHGYPGARRPTRDPTPGYVAAAVTVGVGALLVRVGWGRPSRGRAGPIGESGGRTRECPACGGRIPARAARCYHCAGVVREPATTGGGRGASGTVPVRAAPPDNSDRKPAPVAPPGSPSDRTEMADYAARFAAPAAPEPPTPVVGPSATSPAGTSPNPEHTGAYTPTDWASAAPAADPGLIAGRYELGPELARGGMGVVHRATDRAFDREVAIKMLTPRLAGTPAADRFLDEARITGRLQHPSIPPVHEVGVLPDGNPYLVMKLIRGRTLADEVASAPRPSARADLAPAGLDDDREQESVGHRERLLRAFEQVCLAVAFAHSRRVVHRDLKPQNVMVGAFGEVQVMDWGLAKELGAAVVAPPAAGPAEPADGPEDRTRAGDVVGTPAYMPPEQARGENHRVDERADVFALGGVLCAILTGRAPYQGGSGAEVLGKAAAAELDDAAARLDAVAGAGRFPGLARKCLAPDPTARFAHAGEVAAAVHDAFAKAEQVRRQAELAAAAEEADRAERLAHRTTRRATLIGGGSLLLGVVATAVAVSYLNSAADLDGSQRAQATAARAQRARELFPVVCDAVSRGMDAGRFAPGHDGDYREQMHRRLGECVNHLEPGDKARAYLVEAAMTEAAGDQDRGARGWERAVEAYKAVAPDGTRVALACDAVGWFAGPAPTGKMERMILAAAVRVIAPAAGDAAAPVEVRRRATDALAAAAKAGVPPPASPGRPPR